MATPVNNYPPNKYNDNNYRAPENPHHASQYSIRSAKSISETPKPHTPRSGEAETDEDNLSMLNIPDMPLSSARLTEQAVLAGTSLIRLVETPLPADFEVADATSPLESAKAENGGRCQSKYWGPGSLNDISQHIRETNEWNAISRDPIFLTFKDDSHVIPLEDLLSLYNPGRINEAIHGLEDQDDGAVQEPNSPKNDSDTWDIMDSLEQSLSAGRLKKPDSTSSNDITLEDQSQPPRDTEKLLAALGVTGASKPIGATARPYPLPPLEQNQHSSLDDNSRSRSRSLSRHNRYAPYPEPFMLEVIPYKFIATVLTTEDPGPTPAYQMTTRTIMKTTVKLIPLKLSLLQVATGAHLQINPTPSLLSPHRRHH